jgi:hypothetical protein
VKKAKLHLLINVYVNPFPLNKFKTKHVQTGSETFRIDRFLTSCLTIKNIPWETVSINVKLHESWSARTDELNAALLHIFPEAEIKNQRIENRQSWAFAVSHYEPDDLVYVKANDDHALVCQSAEYFEEFCSLLAHNSEIKMAALTHFPEMRNLAEISNPEEVVSYGNHVAVKVKYAIGTQLVRASFLQSWWVPGRISDDTFIFRPDNPFGESVSFENSQMLIPNIELFRHLDGYSHIFRQKPLTPLRNLVNLGDFPNSNNLDSAWRIGNWPYPLYGSRGFGCDLHSIALSGAKSSGLRSNVATLQALWAMNIHLRSGMRLLRAASGNNTILIFWSVVLALFSPPVIINIPDWFIMNLLVNKKFIGKLKPRNRMILFYFQYHGLFRGLIIRLIKFQKSRRKTNSIF